MLGDYTTTASWALFFCLFVATAVYATRRRWEPTVRASFPLYNSIFPVRTNILGLAGAGYLPGNSATGALPRSHLLPISDTASHSTASTRLSTSSGGANSSFQSDLESGLSSEMFNLSDNAREGDSRGGLAEDSKLEIQNIMRECHVGFDEARAMYTARVLERNNIGADGLPRDPRAVFFS
ncbi:hypothetical protein BZA70DRAFT_270590 [Myxozyma melibiosi]|uniref:Uncharacterized protein n=1 Tax=Myxozyma melibiosi TaxID=54550 RepID=A0ABR1FBC6_9ASCO